MGSTSCNGSMIQLIFIMEDDGYTVNVRTKRPCLLSNPFHSLCSHSDWTQRRDMERMLKESVCSGVEGMGWTGESDERNHLTHGKIY